MGKVYNTLVVRKDNTSISYNDYDAINKMKIGVLQGAIDTDKFIEWCSKRGLSPNIIKVATNTKLPDDCTVISYTASKQCFAALNKGLVDAAVIGSAGANYYINVNRASNYSLNTLNGYGYQIAAGVNRNENSAVISIINRCIHQTDSSVINDFILKHSTVDSDSFNAFINKIPVSVALVFILVLLLVIILLVLVVVSFYTRNKQKEELRIAKKENQIKTDFLGTMSHDMRTPLNAVLGFTGLEE